MRLSLLSPGLNRQHLALIGIVALAAGLRLWGLIAGSPVWHPDEFRFVFFPLNFFSGDLNPHFFNYPTLLFYLLGVVYAACFWIQSLLGGDWSTLEFAAYHYFWDADSLLLFARLTNVGFAVGTVLWSFYLARRLRGEKAGLIAASLLALCTLHVRQSPLAAVDVPMTFWFVGATWASVRLLQREGLQDYLLAGILVGLAAATKYPGGLAGAGVVAAHLLARRTLLDRRLWLAGLASLCAFALVTPYALLDVQGFWQNFAFEAGHLSQGRADLGIGWWYHLKISLRYSLGWTGLLLTAAALLQAVRRPRREVWVAIVVFVAYLVVMGAGKLVFVRYALPLAALQCALAADAIAQLRGRRWLLVVALLAALEPLYGSLRIVQLQGRDDTRIEARKWMERHVPTGARCCNFGGWAGDVQVREMSDLWWRVSNFERNFGRAALSGSLDFLESHAPDTPFYQYAVLTGDRQLDSGDARIIRDRKCSYVILHRHLLGYSRVDSSFAAWLATKGRRIAHWAPEGLERSNPQYDLNDAYYIPLGNFGELRQSGPEIEIWRVDQYESDVRKPQTSRQLFADAYLIWAANKLRDGALEEALELTYGALQLEGASYEGLSIMAELFRHLHRFDEALQTHTRIEELYPGKGENYHGMALLHADLRDHQQALEYYAKAVEQGEDNSRLRNNMAVSHMALEDYPQAILQLRAAIQRDSSFADALYNLGTVYYQGDQFEQAIHFLQQTVERRPNDAKAFNNLAWAHLKLGKYDIAIHNFRQAIAASDGQLRSRYQKYLAQALFLNGSYEEAIGIYQKARGEAGRTAGESGADEAKDNRSALDALARELEIEIGRQKVLLQVHRAEARLAAGDTAVALKILRQVAGIPDGSVGAYARAGLLLFRLGDIDASTQAYQKELESDPDNTVARTNLGWNLYLAGDLDGAEEQYAAVVGAAPNSVAMFNLGLVYVVREDLQKARQAYAQAVAQFGAGEGKRIGAVQDLKDLLEHGEHAAAARTILRAHWPEEVERDGG